MQKPDFSLHVHRGNAKPWALALSECFITRRKTLMGEGRGTEGDRRTDRLSSRTPSVLPVSFYQYSSGLPTTHAASCSLPVLSLFFLQCWLNNWRVQIWPPPSHPPTRFHLSLVLWLSKTALFVSQHGAASVASAPFSQLFNSPQRSIMGMTVPRKEGEIKQNG